ncbi:MAG TPA: SRPBCC domain-containing protein [Solirubrobacteraceae bacterium]
MDVSREIILPVDRDTAWEAVTDLDRWLTADGGCTLELEPGADGELTLPSGETRWATVESVEEGELLAFWWHAPDALATLVEVTLIDAVAGTRVVVVERGYASQPVCGSPWAGGAWSGPRAQSSAAATASPSYPMGSAWVVSALEWEPALARLHDACDLVAA